MKFKSPYFKNRSTFILLFILLSAFQSVFAQVEWRPVTQAELDMKTPLVEPDADAEAIFWEVRLDDKKSSKMFYNHYVRVKIFTERGRERFSKFDIPFTKGKIVEDVAARVIKPDGTIVNLQPSDIFEREILKAGKLLVKAKSFAVPGIAPGVIVEYQYKETFKKDSADGERLLFQRDIPMQSVAYYVRPYKNMSLSWLSRNMAETGFKPTNDNFYVARNQNVPALKSEPQMPPDEEVRQWVLLSYNRSSFNWRVVGVQFGLYFDEQTKPNSEIIKKAGELTAGVSSDEEKLKRIYDFTQKQIKNISFDSTMTDEQIEAIKNKKTSDTLNRRIGNSRDIDFLFASLARAAGFEVKLMLSGNRSENFFNPDKDLGLSYVHPAGIAVKQGHDGWKYCNPGTPYMPFGILDWFEEGVYTLMTNGQRYDWVRSEMSAYSKNLSNRTGKFKLSEDGTLEGSVRVEHNGHQATSRRRDLFAKSSNEREEILVKSWKESIPGAEISGFTFENFEDSAKPYVYSFKVRVPNYAQKTGKRLFFQPNFFENGAAPLFSSATRKHGIYFDFSWSEKDQIEIELPKTYEADSSDSPGDVQETKGIGQMKVNISVDKEKNVLKYERNFYFGSNGNVFFPSGAYRPLKVLFDAFHKANNFIFPLKLKQQ